MSSVARPQVSKPKRATRHSGHAFRKLQAQPQSRFVVHDPPQPTPPALAPSTAPLALRNARLPRDAPRCTTLPRPRVCWPMSSHAAQWHRPVHTAPQAPRCGPVGTTAPLRGPQPPQFLVHEPHWCAGHCFARAQQCPAFRLFWLASGVEKVGASRASVRALERCHQ
jgi:hypothetical protein